MLFRSVDRPSYSRPVKVWALPNRIGRNLHIAPRKTWEDSQPITIATEFFVSVGDSSTFR